MSEDHLDKEVSVSAEMTATSVTASTKSRLVASLDRLGGAIVDNLTARVEGSTDRKRATTKGEVTLIENIVEYGVQQLGASPDLAERAFHAHFRRILASQENKDQVLLEAQNDLRENPAKEDVPGKMSDQFFNVFEPFAEAASTDDLRQLFGRVLAGEIRKPGTFSSKVLRVVGELDAHTAHLFDRLCADSCDGHILHDLCGDIGFNDIGRLVVAGLIRDPGLTGHGLRFSPQEPNGETVWTLKGGDLLMCIHADLPKLVGIAGIPLHDKKNPAVSVYIMTEAGEALSSILPYSQESAFERLAAILATKLAPATVEIFRRQGTTNQFGFERIVSAG